MSRPLWGRDLMGSACPGSTLPSLGSALMGLPLPSLVSPSQPTLLSGFILCCQHPALWVLAVTKRVMAAFHCSEDKDQIFNKDTSRSGPATLGWEEAGDSG